MIEMDLMLNLPTEIIFDIFLLLPIVSILSCKCVCKKWLNLISTPQFSKLRLSPCLVTCSGKIFGIKNSEVACKIFEFEDVVGLQHHNLHYKQLMKFNPNIFSSFPNAGLGPSLGVECSSTDGLICFRDYNNKSVDALYVCNPITHEYVPLPHLSMSTFGYPWFDYVKYGIGISRLSGKPKVVRITSIGDLRVSCVVLTLGTYLWRSIEANELFEFYYYFSDGAYLNGNCHWLVGDAKHNIQIACFDLETELFKLTPPPLPCSFPWFAGLTILGNCLCFCDFKFDGSIIDIWIKKEYGVQESWAKQFSFSLHPPNHVPNPDEQDFYFNPGEHPDHRQTVFSALKVFKDGDILMLSSDSPTFYHCNKTKTNPEIDFLQRGYVDKLLYTPSFVSLRSFGLDDVAYF